MNPAEATSVDHAVVEMVRRCGEGVKRTGGKTVQEEIITRGFSVLFAIRRAPPEGVYNVMFRVDMHAAKKMGFHKSTPLEQVVDTECIIKLEIALNMLCVPWGDSPAPFPGGVLEMVRMGAPPPEDKWSPHHVVTKDRYRMSLWLLKAT